MKQVAILVVVAVGAAAICHPRMLASQTPQRSTTSPQAQQAPQVPPAVRAPTFRSAVEVTTLDVTVVDSDGRPMPGMTPEDFTVRVDNRPRRVVRAEWIPLARPVGSAPIPKQPENYSTNEGSTGGRLILIAIDQPNIRSDGAMGIRTTVDAFLDRLEPDDRVAAVALGGGLSTPFTTNRSAVKEAITHMSGEMRVNVTELGSYSIAPVEALEIADGSQATLQGVIQRECIRAAVRVDPQCPGQIAADSQAIAQAIKQEAERSMGALRGLLGSLKQIEAPKTLVVISEGFVINAPGVPGAVASMASLAAEARTSIFALKLDDRAFDASTKRPPPAAVGDRQLRYAGLDMLTSQARGDVFEVSGNGTAAFQRLEQEISGYYLLGIESEPADTDGKAHSLNVRVAKGGTVRARRDLADVAIARAGTATNPREAVANALSSPLITPNLPLHIATFSMRDKDPAKIQVLLHADIGNDFASAAEVTLGYVISDSKGDVVVHQVGGGRLAPSGISPAPLGYTVSAVLPPGEYTLKFAATAAGRTGSVEHPLHAGLVDAGAVKLSELMIGGPLDSKELMRPEIGYEVAHGNVQGYLEAYGATGTLLMRYEVAPGPEAPSLLSTVVPGQPGADGRTVFSYLMPVKELQPGAYVLRATLSAAGSQGTPPLKRLTRAFRVMPTAGAPAPAAPARPAAAPVAAPAPSVVSLARPFRKDDVLQGSALQKFRDLVAAPARQEFDAGVAALSSNDFVKAEQSFKNAQRQSLASGNSTAPLAYLAATYAASNHDLEATNVWKTALIDGSEHPELYVWLSEALIRVRQFDEARAILKEAAGKWSAETRFAERLAQLPGASGAR